MSSLLVRQLEASIAYATEARRQLAKLAKTETECRSGKLTTRCVRELPWGEGPEESCIK